MQAFMTKVIVNSVTFIQRIPLFLVVSTEDVNQAKAKVLDWFNKVEFSVDSGVEQLSKDFTARLDATATEIRMKFEEQKQKFSDSEYSAKLTELQETLAAKQVREMKECPQIGLLGQG